VSDTQDFRLTDRLVVRIRDIWSNVTERLVLP